MTNEGTEMSGCRHLLDLAASLRAQERGIGQTLRARELEAVAQWIEEWTPEQDERGHAVGAGNCRLRRGRAIVAGASCFNCRTAVDDERRALRVPRNRDTPCAVDGCPVTSPLLRVNPKGELGIFMCPEHAREVG